MDAIGQLEESQGQEGGLAPALLPAKTRFGQSLLLQVQKAKKERTQRFALFTINVRTTLPLGQRDLHTFRLYFLLSKFVFARSLALRTGGKQLPASIHA